MVDVVRRTAACCFMPLTVGGGIRSVKDMREMLLAGADKVSLNTAAINRPELINEGAAAFGSQCIVVAIDAKGRLPANGAFPPMAAVNSWDWMPWNGPWRRNAAVPGKSC